ncbi:MAG: hypothetical protein JOZ19_16685 [Rubrobacter sp.]|nr:hypothetical protein [Rubrobacter sp.]
MSPLRAGFVYGVVAVVVTLVTELRFLFIDPQGIPDWILTVIEGFRTQLALAAYLFLGILAALRALPVRLDPGIPYRSLLLRDCVLASTVVAVMVGVTLFVVTALNATLFADQIRAYARDAAPSIVTYDEKVASRLSNPPTLPTAEEVEKSLQPPVLRDLGRSMFNLVLQALLLGAAGAVVGALRGAFGSDGTRGQRSASSDKRRSLENGESSQE